MARLSAWRESMNLRSLQMMVMSGVVRRADLNPRLNHGRRGFQLPDSVQGETLRRAVPEQGWLSRIFLGRKPQAVLTNRL
jgi:hypothetical protein